MAEDLKIPVEPLRVQRTEPDPLPLEAVRQGLLLRTQGLLEV
jgi:hypothetical protein